VFSSVEAQVADVGQLEEDAEIKWSIWRTLKKCFIAYEFAVWDRTRG